MTTLESVIVEDTKEMEKPIDREKVCEKCETLLHCVI